MTFIKPITIVVLYILCGYRSVDAGAVACTQAHIEECSGAIVGVGSEQEKACDGAAEKSLACLKGLSCEADEAMTTAISGLKTQLSQTIEGCNKAKLDACTLQEKVCMDMKNKEMEGVCGNLRNVKLCLMSDLLTNCENETLKVSVESMKKEVEKDMKESKCCDFEEIQTCVNKLTEISNDTANEKNCMQLGKDIQCVEYLLKSCAEPNFTSVLERAMNSSDISVELCQDKGYKVSDDGNSGAFHQPTMILIGLCFILLKPFF